MVPWAVSTACTRFTPKSSVLTWMPVTGQFSMIWGRGRRRGVMAGMSQLARHPAPKVGKVGLGRALALAIFLSSYYSYY